MSVNKHKALQDFVQQFLDNNYLYFERADVFPGARMIVPTQGDNTLREDICGFKYKRYTFVFIGYDMSDSGTSDTNVDNRKIYDDFNEWIETQEESKNYPDFGEKCDHYKLSPVNNMANLAGIDEQGIAKYMLAVNLDYRERK